MRADVARGSTPDGRRIALRRRRKGETLPDSKSEYDEWGDDVLPIAETAGEVHRLIIECDGTPVGHVTWHRTHYGPNHGSLAWNIGIGLLESQQGLGIGSVAQRVLAEYLLTSETLDRIEASTDVSNIAEQRALEKAGFTREGVLRSAQKRRDGRHDLYSYSFVRDDLTH